MGCSELSRFLALRLDHPITRSPDWYPYLHEKSEAQRPRFTCGTRACGTRALACADRRRIPGCHPGTRAQHVAEDSGGDSLRGAGGGHRGHQLPDSSVQVQGHADVVRRVRRPLQFVSGCVGDRGVQGRTQGLLRLQRDDSLPDRQASAGRAGEKAGEGAGRGKRAQETAVMELALG